MPKILKIFFLLYVFVLLSLSSCSVIKPGSRDKAEAEQRKLDREAQRKLAELEQAHYKAQSPATKRMMKKNAYKSQRLNRFKRR